MNNEFTMSLTGNFGCTSSKVGLTTTVKEQVDNIEVTIDHFKKLIETQSKQQNQIQNQLNILDNKTQHQFKNLLGEIKLRKKQLIETYRNQTQKYSNQMEYLELQKGIIIDEQDKLTQLCQGLQQRVQGMEESVGV